MMDNLRVTTIQTNLHWESADANRAMLEEKISNLSEPTDVIILPEMFTTGFSMSAKSLAEPMNFHTTKWMKNMATKTEALILGSCIIKEGEYFFNRLLWVEPNGDLKTYDKRHLFRMAEEEKVYTAGNKILVAEWKGWKICPLICYDLRFPIWSRNQLNKETNKLSYDVLVYVANWPAARTHHWQSLLTARAIENLSYVVGVNRVGLDGKQISYDGRTTVLDPRGERLYEADNKEEIKTLELKAETLNAWRAKFPAYLDADDFEVK